MPPDRLLDVALASARAAVEVQRARLGTIGPEQWSEKGSADFVTAVDHEAEAAALSSIRAEFPEHAILAEEQATSGDPAPHLPLDPEFLWIVDPLDGTTNYLHRYPMYAASVAVARRGELLAGAVVSGATGEEWTAAKGRGAFKEGRPIRVSSIRRLPQALLGTGFPFKTLELLPEYQKQFDSLLRGSAGIRRAGAAAVDLCHVACGCLDGFWELSLAPWDVAAGILILREAGGVVTRIDGEPPRTAESGSVLAGNPDIHAAMAALLRSCAIVGSEKG